MDPLYIVAVSILILPVFVLCVKKGDQFYTDEEIEAGLNNIKQKTNDQATLDGSDRKPSYLRRDTFLF